MIDDAIIKQVHKLANERLYQNFPLFDMAYLSEHPEGHFKLGEVELILEAYFDIQRATESNSKHSKSTRSKGVYQVFKK